MGSTTTKGYPYPVGTDRVMDGDNAMQALAEAVDSDALFTRSYGTGQSLSAAVTTAVAWNAATENGCALTKTSSTVWTTTLAGLYVVSANISVTGGQAVRAFINLFTGNYVSRAVMTSDSIAVATVVHRMAVGDTIKAEIYAGTATTITAGTAATTWLNVARLGRSTGSAPT